MFEKLSIAEIKRALLHSQSSASKVQLELRDLVAQRYPDLLASAGTVLEMKARSHEMQGTLLDVPRLCSDIANHAWGVVSPLPVDDEKEKQSSDRDDGGPSGALSLSWTTYPEKIWDALDNQKFLCASRELIGECTSGSGGSRRSGTTKSSSHIRLTFSERTQRKQFALQIQRRSSACLGSVHSAGERTHVGALCSLIMFGNDAKSALSSLLQQRRSFVLKCVRRANRVTTTTTTTTSSTSSSNQRTKRKRKIRSSVEKATSIMTKILQCVDSTIMLVRDAFVRGGIAAELESTATNCGMSSLVDLLLLTRSVVDGTEEVMDMVDDDARRGSAVSVTSTDLTLSASLCSRLVSAWLIDVVDIVRAREDSLLPSTMTASDVASIQEILFSFSGQQSADDVPLVSIACGVAYGAVEGAAEGGETTVRALLYRDMFAQRGTNLVSKALEVAMSEYVRGVCDGVCRIDEANGAGSKGLGDVAKQLQSFDLALLSSSSPGTAKLQRSRAYVEKTWAINYSTVVMMDLSSSLSSVLLDARRLSIVQCGGDSGALEETPLTKTLAVMATKFDALLNKMKKIANEKGSVGGGSSGGGSGGGDDGDGDGGSGEEESGVNRETERKTLDHVLLVGACCGLLSKFVVEINSSPSTTTSATANEIGTSCSFEHVMEDKTRHLFQTCSNNCVRQWSKHLVSKSYSSFQECVQRAKQGKMGRYGWIRVRLNEDDEDDDDVGAGEEEEEEEGAAVEMPTTCSPHVVDMLYQLRRLLSVAPTKDAGEWWCGDGTSSLSPAQSVQLEMWCAVMNVLESELSMETDQMNEQDVLQFVLDLTVLEKICPSTPSVLLETRNKLKHLKETMISQVDPVEWTLYESMVEDTAIRQLKRVCFFTSQDVVSSSSGSTSHRNTFSSGGGGYTDVSQNILPMASTPGRFPLLPVARTGRKKSFGTIMSPQGSPKVQSRHQTPGGSANGVTKVASDLFSSITTSFWGD